MVAALAACAGGGSRPDGQSGNEAVDKVVDPSLIMAARAAEGEHDYLAAAKHYRTLYRRHPENRQLLLALARTLRYAGMPQDSITLLNAHLEQHGDDATALTELGKAYLASDRANVAVRFLREARALEPQNWEIHSALGVAYDYLGDHAAAQEAYGVALTLSPNNPTVLNNLALSHAQAGEIDAAIERLRQAMEQPSATPQMRQNLALLLALRGDLETAKRMTYKDLPETMIRDNVAFYRLLTESRREQP